jgi:hypothetical protein
MRRSIFLLVILCAPAFPGAITYTSASWSGEGFNYAQAGGSENFTGTGSLVTLYTQLNVSSSWIEHRPRQPPGSGWDIIYHPGGTATAVAGDTFQVIAGTEGTGRVEADVVARTLRAAQFSITLAGTQFFPNPFGTAGQQYSVAIPLGQPFVIDMRLSDSLSNARGDAISEFELKALRFYDADGQPVEAQLGTPEPGTWSLTVSALLALYGWKRCRDRTRQRRT